MIIEKSDYETSRFYISYQIFPYSKAFRYSGRQRASAKVVTLRSAGLLYVVVPTEKVPVVFSTLCLYEATNVSFPLPCNIRYTEVHPLCETTIIWSYIKARPQGAVLHIYIGHASQMDDLHSRVGDNVYSEKCTQYIIDVT